MNWRTFIAECQEFRDWLGNRGEEDPGRILLKALILVWRGRGTLPPGAVVSQAMRQSPLRGAAREDFSLCSCDHLPDRINSMIETWSRSLPGEACFLGELHERLAVGRRASGVYYTSPDVIDFITAHTMELADVVNNPYVRVMDPACGCGYFLLKAYDVLWAKYVHSRQVLAGRHPGKDWSDNGIHRHIISHNLWGADIDPLAVELTAVGLFLKRPESSKGLEPNLAVCDSLRRPEKGSSREERVFWSGSYDYVVGNPPYLSFGLRGAKRLEPGYEKYLREAYKDSAEYKLSYYVLFIQRGLEMLSQGGKLGFIVPDSFLLGRYYSKIRRYILDQAAIEALAHVSTPVFKNAAVGMSAVCILRKENSPAARACQLIAIHQAQAKGDLKPEGYSLRYSQSYFEGLLHTRFRIFSDLTVKNLIDKIDDNSEPLGNFASGHSGIRARTKQKDIVSDLSGGNTWRRGLVSGGQVQRYGLEYKGHWLNIDPRLLYKGGWDPAVISRRKLLVRQTGYTLTACIEDKGYYHLNNIHNFILKNRTVRLDYLLLLLNSRLMSFYYHAVAMEYGRVMAQTDIDVLELLPVRVHSETDVRAPGLVARMQGMVARQLAGEQGLDDSIHAFDDALNQLVYQIYDLNDADIACVERYETNLAARRRRPKGC